MATETPAQMAARFRKIAKDPKLPQAVKNTYLDKAIAVEKEAAKPTMAKGGAVVAKAPAMKAAKAPKASAMKKAPALAVMIAVGKPKAKMAKGGAVAKAPAKKGMK